MRQTLRLLRPAPNQNIDNPRLWQDPVLGYYETHGKMRFEPGEQYNMSDEEKKAVLWRYRVKEILKKEFLRREWNPHTFKYKEGVIMDPAMFRWYAAEMTRTEYLRYTPKGVFLYVGCFMFLFYLYTKIGLISKEKSVQQDRQGDTLWWDRLNKRGFYVGGHGHPTPTYGGYHY